MQKKPELDKENKIKNSVKYVSILIIFVSLLYGLYHFFIFQNVQKTGLKATNKISTVEIDRYIDFLNRERFTEESKKHVRNFIKEELKKYGYTVTEQKTDGSINGTVENRIFINIIADRGDITNEDILIGAHYDTVPGIFGIDDNASGVAALLAVAKYNQNPKVRFVAFDGEEYNLSGSRFYVKQTNSRPKLMVSLETMGYYSDNQNTQFIPALYNFFYRDLYNRLKHNGFRGNFSASICTFDANKFCDDYESYAASLNLQVYTLSIPPLPFIRNYFWDLFRSDHTPFLLKGIPVVMVTDTANFRSPHYHKKTDTRNTVNVNFITKQANAILSIVSDK